jgi:hypothetical protein
MQISYSIPHDTEENPKKAAELAKVMLFNDWDPDHWHLDSVSWNLDRTVCSFSTGRISGWHSDDIGELHA